MKTLPLSGKWKLSNRTRKLSVAAVLPGDTHSALLKAGVLQDPYYGQQELEAQWVGREDWTYEREFQITSALLREQSIFLNLEQADTLLSVFINDKPAGQTGNAFLRHRLEIKPLLKVGKNTIRIVIQSAEVAAARLAAKLPYPIPHSHFPVQSPHRNLVRKPQCHAGWDWGPCLMVAGIYGEIYLAAVSQARIEHVMVNQFHSQGKVAVEISCELESPQGGKTPYEITFGGQKLSGTLELAQGSNHLVKRLQITNPRLWWPNGYGQANLYDLTLTVGSASVQKKVGLRTIEAKFQEDRHGLGLEFRVNGIPVFAKGANWIPADALPQRISREVLDDLLNSATQAHMNMLRVWGGGQYESEEFYDLCDAKGLMVWQDFMFSCGLYPASDAFLSNVRQEAEYQVKRLQHRACLALWCGNNENVGAMKWYEESRQNRDRYLVDYDRLNEGVLGNTLRSLDPSRTFWPSSPCGGPGDYSDCWHDDTRGDMHFWSVWHESKPFEDYLKIKPRFCSEFGYQSFPSLESIKTYAPKSQWNLTSPIMEHHQKNPGGNTRITENMTRYFRFPDGFENFVYLSQLQQGIAIKTAVEHFRRLRPVCMGALYWQLNDLWPVCSWGSLNYGGKWKLLHHMTRSFFAPLAVSIRQTENGYLEIWGCSDLLQSSAGILSIRLMDFSGKVLRKNRIQTTIPKLSSKCLYRSKIDELAAKPDSVFLEVDLKSGSHLARNTHFFTLYKHCELAQPKIAIKVKAAKEKGAFEVELSTDLPAFAVSLNADNIRGEFNDNVLTLLPGSTRKLVFDPKQKTTLQQFRQALKINHLRASYS